MKKQFIILTAAFFLFCLSTQAQVGNSPETPKTEIQGKKFKINLGVEGALPMGDLKNGYSFGAGLTLRFLYKVTPQFGVTFTTGAIGFAPKDLNANAKVLLNIPFKAGGRYMITNNFYGLAEIGMTQSMMYFTDQQGKISHISSNAFTYAPSIGVILGGLDASLRYETMSKNGASSSFLALRLGFFF